MNLKTALTSIAALTLATGLLAQNQAPQAFTEDVRQALKGAADKAQSSIASSRIASDQAVSVFFIEGDRGGYVETLVRDAVLAAGRTYVVPNDDENRLLQKIYSEIEFDERKEGMVSPRTVERVNAASLKSTQVLVYGNVWTVVDNDRYVLVEISLGAYSIATKEFLWAGQFDCRHYKPGKEPGVTLVDLPLQLRTTMQNDIKAAIKDSIGKQLKTKLAAVKTVVVLPLAGDEFGGYITHIVVDAVTDTDLTARDSDVQTRAEVLRAIRDRPQIADAVLFGAVRALDFQVVKETPREITFAGDVELQLTIEGASTRNILLSETVSKPFTYVVPKDIPPGFLKLLIDRLGKKGLVAIAIVALVLLIVIGRILNAATRVR